MTRLQGETEAIVIAVPKRTARIPDLSMPPRMIYSAPMVDFLLLLAVIPIVTGVIGWFTNYVAVKMIFAPRHFRGVGPLGCDALCWRRRGHDYGTPHLAP